MYITYNLISKYIAAFNNVKYIHNQIILLDYTLCFFLSFFLSFSVFLSFSLSLSVSYFSLFFNLFYYLSGSCELHVSVLRCYKLRLCLFHWFTCKLIDLMHLHFYCCTLYFYNDCKCFYPRALLETNFC